MPSQQQVQYHVAMQQQLLEAQTDAQARLQAEAAARQAERDAALAQQQAASAQQQAGFQSERDAAANAYQQQQMGLQANLQDQMGARRDYRSTVYQGALQGQQNDFTLQRDANQAQYRSQEQVQHVDLQARLQEVTLNQQEEMRVHRLKQAISEVDQQVQGGYLEPQEAAALKTQLVTGLNPLANRQAEAQRIQTVLQTQAIHQQNEQGATLFNQRQQWLANGAQGNIRYLEDPVTGERQAFQVGPNGEIQPIDFSRNRREQEQHAMGLAQGIQGIQSSQGANQRAEGMFPLQQESMRTATAGQRQQIDFATEANPMRLEAAALANTGERDQQAFLRQLQPRQLEMLGTQINRSITEGQSAIQEMAARRQEIPLQQLQRQVQLRLTQEQLRQAPLHFENQQMMDTGRIALLQQQVEQGPQAFASQQAFEGARTQLLEQQVAQGPRAFASQQAYENARTDLLEQQIRQGPRAFRTEQAYREAVTEHSRMQTESIRREMSNGLSQRQSTALDTSIREEVNRDLQAPRAGQTASALHTESLIRPGETPEQHTRRVDTLRDREAVRRREAALRRLGVNQGNVGGEAQANALQALMDQLANGGQSRTAGPVAGGGQGAVSPDERAANAEVNRFLPGDNSHTREAVGPMLANVTRVQNGFSFFTTPHGVNANVDEIRRTLLRANEENRALSQQEQVAVRRVLRDLPADVRRQITQ